MDQNITRLRAQDAAGEVASNPNPSPADARGQYEFLLIEVVRTVAQLAAQRDGMALEQLQAAPCPLDPSSPLVLAARGALLERGYRADGTLPRFGTGDRREDPLGCGGTGTLAGSTMPCPGCDACHLQAVDLESIERYRQQMAAIGVAAIGYWTEAMGIHPDYDTVPLRDVAKLYAKYEALQQLQAVGQLPAGDAIVRYVKPEYVARLRTDRADALGIPLCRAPADGLVPVLITPGDDWILTDEQQPHDGQKVWITSVAEYSNAPPDYAVLESVFEFGNFRSPCGQMYSWPKHWKPRVKPVPPLLEQEGGA